MKPNIDVSIIEVVNFFDSCRWKTAKSMPQWPHEYTVQSWNDVEVFDAVKYYINEGGQEELWHWEMYGKKGTKRRLYFYLDGYKYWTTQPNIDNKDLTICDVINRAAVD